MQVRDVRDPPAVRAVAMHTRLRGVPETCSQRSVAREITRVFPAQETRAGKDVFDFAQAFPCRGQAGENLLLKSLSLWMASAGDVPDNR